MPANACTHLVLDLATGPLFLCQILVLLICEKKCYKTGLNRVYMQR